MRIVLQTTGQNDVVLCDGPDPASDKSRGPIAYGIEQSSLFELAPGTRATSQLLLERGNVAHTIRFSVSRECLSHGAAILWAHEHMKAIAARKASVALLQPASAMTLFMSAGTYLVKLTPVGVSVVGVPQFLGSTVIVNYQIIFGAWS